MRSRVRPGVLCTSDEREPTRLLNSVDLPTFGQPIRETVNTREKTRKSRILLVIQASELFFSLELVFERTGVFKTCEN
jgi:hypothetical protein